MEALREGIRFGPWVSYYDNGQVQSKGTYSSGHEDGVWVEYYDNGQLDAGCRRPV